MVHVLSAWLTVASTVLGGAVQVPVPYDSARTQIVLLGTGNPNPDPERAGPATAVVVRGRAYLVDAGPGIVRRAAAAAVALGGLAARARPKLLVLTHGLPWSSTPEEIVREVRAGFSGAVVYAGDLDIY